MSKTKAQYYATLLSIAFNGLIPRLFFTSMCTLITVYLNLQTLQSDPNSIKWILSIVFTDVIAYGMGSMHGANEALRRAAERILMLSQAAEKSDKIGKEGDHREE